MGCTQILHSILIPILCLSVLTNEIFLTVVQSCFKPKFLLWGFSLTFVTRVFLHAGNVKLLIHQFLWNQNHPIVVGTYDTLWYKDQRKLPINQTKGKMIFCQLKYLIEGISA